jgi:hypothetical protein
VTDADPPGHEDFERLAARLAMLASDNGEADNAGRAVGAMARRLGLTGGDLKRIFLAGAAGIAGGDERERLSAEVSTLRHSLLLLDADARRVVVERDLLRAENGRLQGRLDGLKGGLRVAGLGAVAVVVVLCVVGLSGWIGTPDASVAVPAPRAAPGALRSAVVRPGGALLFRGPERSGLPLAVLPGGLHIAVRRLVWKDLYQWAEVEAPGGWRGYVLTTEIDLS